MYEQRKKELKEYIDAMANLAKKQESILGSIEQRFGIIYEHNKKIFKIIDLAKDLIKEFKIEEKNKLTEEILKLKHIILMGFEPIMKEEQSFIEQLNLINQSQNKYSQSQRLLLAKDYEQLKHELEATKDEKEDNAVSKALNEELDNLKKCMRKQRDIQTINEYLADIQKKSSSLINEIKPLVIEELRLLDKFILGKQDFLRERAELGGQNAIAIEDFQETIKELRPLSRKIVGILRKEKEHVLDPLRRAIKNKESLNEEVENIIAGNKGKITIETIKKDLRAIATQPEQIKKYAEKMQRRPYSDHFYPESQAENIARYLEKVSGIAQVKIEEELRRQAGTDGLTGLKNRKVFDELMDWQVNSSERTHDVFSLIMIDIDHFKIFNDTYGHQTGDYVLKFVSKIIQRKVRKVDIACRYGGEEIAVILPKTNKDGAINIAEKIRRSVEEISAVIMRKINKEKEVKSKKHNITVSIGLSTYPEDGKDAETIISKSDKALYFSKHPYGEEVKDIGRNMVTACGREKQPPRVIPEPEKIQEVHS